MENKKYFKSPLWCPKCDEELSTDGTFLFCENSQCLGKKQGNLNKWVKALDVYDISEKTIELFERAGLVSTPADFYKLTVNAIANLESMGEKSGTKIVNNFNNKKNLDLATFIDGLNITNFSKSRAEILIENGIDTLDKMRNVKEKELVTFKGIGSEIAEIIVFGLSDKKTTIDKLLEVVTITDAEKPKEIEMHSNKLPGEVFVFTGGINKIDAEGKRFTRKMLENLVYENGGECKDSITKDVTGLVQADPNSASSKTKKASSLGIKIIGEEDFFKMLGM